MGNADFSVMDVISRVVAIFLLTLFGVLAKKLGYIKKGMDASFSDILINITIPCLVFTSVTSGIEWKRLISGIYTPIIAIVVALIILVCSIAISRLLGQGKELSKTFQMLCTIPNSGFIGFAVVFALFGETGLSFAVLFDFGFAILLWTVMVTIISGEKLNRQTIKHLANPAIIAILLALLINYLGLKPPYIISEPLRLMGNVTIPLAMMLLGYTLAGLKMEIRSNIVNITVVVIVKLILYPCVAWLIIWPLNLDPIVRSVILIQSAMPAMASTTVFAQKYHGDVNFSTTVIFITTILSIITIPLVIFWLV